MKKAKSTVSRQSSPAPVNRRILLTSDVNPDSFRRLAIESVAQLRDRYVALIGIEPPMAFGSDLLRRTIAHGIQQRAYGGPSRATQRLLAEISKAKSSKLTRAHALPRRIKIGSELVRDWKGKSYRIVVTSKGFRLDGNDYASLSEVASHITGTNWNGPRFFGFRPASGGGATNGKKL